MKKADIIKSVVFTVMLFSGTIAATVCPDKEYSVMENRELAQRPCLSKENVLRGKFQSEYETYLNEQFPMRDKCIDVSVLIQASLGKKDINGVYLGKEGYLLEKNEKKDFDTEQVKENVKTLASFLNDMTEEYGKEHVSCMMIPSKTLALSNMLPAFANIPEYKDVLVSLQNQLSHPNCLLDMTKILQQHQNEYIYYRTDHHWTTLGAYYAYQAWAEQTGQATPHPLNNYERETVFSDFYGTTYNKVHIQVPKDEVQLFHNPAEKNIHVNMDDGDFEADSFYFPKEASKGFNRYQVFLSKNTFKIEITTQAKTGKTLLLIKDSFANCFVPFLAEDYERIVMIDYRYGKVSIGNILSEYEDISDILVLFNTEKFMQNTKLNKLADTERRQQTLEEFNPEDFLE